MELWSTQKSQIKTFFSTFMIKGVEQQTVWLHTVYTSIFSFYVPVSIVVKCLFVSIRDVTLDFRHEVRSRRQFKVAT